jgi:L-asparagine transporter-like permease
MGFRSRAPKGAPRKFPMPLYPLASWVVLGFIVGIALIMATYLGMYIPIGFAAGFYLLLGLIYALSGEQRRRTPA